MKQRSDNFGCSFVPNVVGREQCSIQGRDCQGEQNGCYVCLSETSEREFSVLS